MYLFTESVSIKKIAKLQTVAGTDYLDILPKEMGTKLLSEMSETVFGVDFLEIYLERSIFETRAVIISDFSSNGFFWAQSEDELMSPEYRNVYETINIAAEESYCPVSKLETKWCVAKFQGEWFRYITTDK